MKRHDRPFVVGRRTSRGTTMVVLREQEKPVFRGPWTVTAVVSPPRPVTA
jgi:hypothetical protein